MTTIESGPAAETGSTSASFAFSSNEPGSSFRCTLDGEVLTPCISPLELQGLAVGLHELGVQAVDAASNADPTPALHSWRVVPPPDTTAPETSIDSGPAASGPETGASFAFSASETGSSFECSLDGAAFADCVSPKSYEGIAIGDHTFRVQATDAAGNTDSTPAEQRWTVESPPDTVAPDTSILEGPANPTSSGAAIFQFTGSDNVSPEPALEFECSLDGAAFAECTSSHSLADLAHGSHTFEVRAVDLALNKDPSPAGYTWVVDRLAPETTIDSGPASSPDTGGSVAFSASESGSSFECALDGAAFAPCSSPSPLSGLAVGSHTFAVRATDAVGNVDDTPASHTWTVQLPPDTAAPETSIGSGPAASTSSTSASFAFSADEAGSSFECALDAAAYAACTSPRDYSGLAVGSHTFRVRAIDVAGNVDSTPAERTWTITPPCSASTVTLDAVADAWILQSSATSNYEKDSVLKVDTKSGANARALVRFALPAIPAGCRVVDAKLRLYASSYKEGRTVQAVQLTQAWEENKVTWANQPTTSTTGTPAEIASGNTSGYREWVATPLVASMYVDGNHGFLIRDKAENGNGVEQGFHSREKGTDNPPKLVITFGQ